MPLSDGIALEPVQALGQAETPLNIGKTSKLLYYPRSRKLEVMKNVKAVAIDLFCGAGGLTYGLEKSGVSVALGVDLDPLCQYPFTENTKAKFLQKDVSALSAKDFEGIYPADAYKILVGCAPCQPFSTYTQGRQIRDSRWSLLDAFAKLALDLKPDVISMENVAQLTRHDIYTDFVTALESVGYNVSGNIVECERYGIPQTRRRLVLLASLHGKVALIPPTHQLGDSRVTVRNTIAGLQPLEAGHVAIGDPLHITSKLSARNLERIVASKPGGTWKDWDESLRSPCHKRATGAHYGGVYGRMEWDKPGPTITTQSFGFGNGRFGHPEQNRALSLREAALLQTFPKKYKFLKRGTATNFKGIGRLIGNAVPVRLGVVIGRSISNHLEGVRKHAKS